MTTNDLKKLKSFLLGRLESLLPIYANSVYDNEITETCNAIMQGKINILCDKILDDVNNSYRQRKMFSESLTVLGNLTLQSSNEQITEQIANIFQRIAGIKNEDRITVEEII